MTPEEINRTIHEAMGKCWHSDTYSEWGNNPYGCNCVKCKASQFDYDDGVYLHQNPNPSYTSSWADYGKTLEWAKEQYWFNNYIYWVTVIYPLETCLRIMIDVYRGSTALATFIVEHPEIFRKEEK